MKKILPLFFVSFFPLCGAESGYLYQSDQDNVHVSVKRLEDENKKIARLFVPLEIAVENKSKNVVSIGKKNIGLEVAPLRDVAACSKKKIAHSFLWPLPLTAGLIFIGPAAFAIGYGVVACTSAAALAGRSQASREQQLQKQATDFSYAVTILPQGQFRKIIYVPKEKFTREFTVSVEILPEDDAPLFTIDLEEKSASRTESINEPSEQVEPKASLQPPAPQPISLDTPLPQVTPLPQKQVEVETDVFETVIEFNEE